MHAAGGGGAAECGSGAERGAEWRAGRGAGRGAGVRVRRLEPAPPARAARDPATQAEAVSHPHSTVNSIA